ncbi:MAG: NIPSNAP family protein [Verrucomicrobiales bacterium]
MKTIALLLFALSAILRPVSGADEPAFFELRTYHAHEGKLDELHARFRDHTLALFEKHGMTNVAYWVPPENEDQVLIYLLGYLDREAREEAWQTFRDDPEWKEVFRKSTAEGKLVEKVDSVFLTLTDYSPPLPGPTPGEPRLFEMRRYTANPGKLDDLDARFRDHTIKLFEKHDIANLPYFHLAENEKKSDATLLYFLAHESKDARDAAFKAFSEDPVWTAARQASEENGKLLVEGGVESTLLEPTDYSPLK